MQLVLAGTRKKFLAHLTECGVEYTVAYREISKEVFRDVAIHGG